MWSFVKILPGFLVFEAVYKGPKLRFYKLKGDLVVNTALLDVLIPAFVELGGFVTPFAKAEPSAVKDGNGF